MGDNMSKGMLGRLIHKCHDKKRLTSRKLARLHAQRMTKNYDTHFKHYYCAFCGGFHVGRTSTKKAR